jgi:hypothetical protein
MTVAQMILDLRGGALPFLFEKITQRSLATRLRSVLDVLGDFQISLPRTRIRA